MVVAGKEVVAKAGACATAGPTEAGPAEGATV